jgi:hypothetical protein
MLLLERDPGDIVSFAQLQALMQHTAPRVRASREAEFPALADGQGEESPGAGQRLP